MRQSTNDTRPRTSKDLLKRSKWMLHGRSNTRRERYRDKDGYKEEKKEARQKSKKIVLKAQIAPKIPVSATKSSRDLATRSAIFFLFSSTTVSRYVSAGYSFELFSTLNGVCISTPLYGPLFEFKSVAVTNQPYIPSKYMDNGLVVRPFFRCMLGGKNLALPFGRRRQGNR